MNEKYITYKYLQGATWIILSLCKCITLHAPIKTKEKLKVNELSIQLKKLGKNKKNPKVSKRKEIIKIRSGINEKEMKEKNSKDQ